MCRITDLKTHNVKFHFKLNLRDREKVRKKLDEFSQEGESWGWRLKFCRNFIVLHVDFLTITVFVKNGHVNITGVKDFDETDIAVRRFDKIFSTSVAEKNPTEIKIDNSTSTGKITTCNLISLHKLGKSEAARNSCFTVSFRPHFFPGVVFRRRVKHLGCGTAIYFNTSSFVIVGSKKRQEVNQTAVQLCATIHNSIS